MISSLLTVNTANFLEPYYNQCFFFYFQLVGNKQAEQQKQETAGIHYLLSVPENHINK